LQLALSELD